MIEGLKPYAEYKSSGHRWLGSIPNHWSVLPNRALFDEIKDRNHPKEEMLSVTITRGIVRQKALLDGSSKKDSSNLNKGAYKLVQPHDIAYNKMRAWQGALGASTLRGIISPAYVVMRPRKEANPWFYHNLYRTPSFAKEAERWSYGITSDMWSLRPEHFKVIGSVLPPPDEQAAIVRFLDHANRKIDGFIRAKRKLIGLLNEQKQAIIHRAVTRGLDSSVPLKPSGIPWLGDIPKHWDVRRLRFCIVGKLTYGANAAAEFDNPDWPRYLRITDFNSDGSLRADTFRSLPPHVAKDYPVEDGDILFARSGATVGKAFLVRTETEKACYAGYLIRARPNADLVLPTFLFAFTQSTAFACWKDAIFNRATIQNIGADKYANLVVPIPPVPEQQAILDFVEKDIAPLRTAIARTEKEISLMQEYRTRLTADLVTGKLDVRGAAAKLPSTVEDGNTEEARNELAYEGEEEILES
jgi:type I restriction enzyme S subunit